jgi:hypothetical protein
MKTYKLCDTVLARVMQIVQEAMLTGTDCVDLMRVMELQEGNSGTLVLTDGYKQLVKKEHDDLIKLAEERQKA